MNDILVYVEGGNTMLEGYIQHLGWGVTDNPEDCNVLLFSGGEDVHPMYYGEEPHPNAGPYDIHRDGLCETLFLKAAYHDNVIIVGICRGAQFVNVMCGGSLIQDIGYDHCRDHYVNCIYPKYDKILVSSTHHQVMLPGPGASVLMTSSINPDNMYSEPIAECVQYGDTILCLQSHPEYLGYDKLSQFFKEKVENMFANWRMKT